MNEPFLARADVRSFIEVMETEHGLDAAELERVLGDVQHQPLVARLIGPQPQSASSAVRSYPAYRARFLTTSRILAGAEYWRSHESVLRRAEAEFKVPAEIILGIIGVETAFGQNTGSFRVLDTLATIAFDGPRRQDYFREELKEFFLLTREMNLDPLAIKGSYAGAMGLPQFMPSSYRRYAVDFDGDGTVDIVSSAADAIGSVASYLSAHGWLPDEPAALPVRLSPGSEAELVSGLERLWDTAQLLKKGVEFSDAAPPRVTCSVVELPVPGKQSKYLAGFTNFEVITQYNRSTFYAAAVLDLADAIALARRRQQSMVADTASRVSL